MMVELEQIGARAKAVEHAMGILSSDEKNRGLMLAAEALVKRSEEILKAMKKISRQPERIR